MFGNEKIVNYQINFTSRQLSQICDYYNIPKPKKFTKEELAHLIVEFEQNNENAEIVCKRQLMWFYMDELKNDKYMKKYILFFYKNFIRLRFSYSFIFLELNSIKF